MALLFIAPNRSMNVGNNQRALYAPFASAVSEPAVNGSSGTLTQVLTENAGWWDASSTSGLMESGGSPVVTWNTPGDMLTDLTGNGRNLVPFSNPSSTNL